MPSPRIFVSSTCYDLRHIRENLKFFIRSLGLEPVLSEEGSVFYDPRMNVQEACTSEVPSCQILVLIIGGRYGSLFRNSDSSVTNHEYRSAVRGKIPIFALVERGVLDDYRVYKANCGNPDLNPTTIRYPAADSTKIFDFIDEVQAEAINNALVPFSDFEEMQDYLKQQWASMFYRFLTTEGEARRTADILVALGQANDRIEFLTRCIVESVGNDLTKATVELYDILLQSKVAADCQIWNIRVTPRRVFERKTFDDFCDDQVEVNPNDTGHSITSGGPPYHLSRLKYEDLVEEYDKLRQRLEAALADKKVSVTSYLSFLDSSSSKPLMSVAPVRQSRDTSN